MTDGAVAPSPVRLKFYRGRYRRRYVGFQATMTVGKKHSPCVSGYLGVDETPLMHHVGCETCHGPGSAHVEVEQAGGPSELLNKLRAEVRLPLPEAERKCIECHDLDSSIEFHEPGAFDRYWKQIEH